MPGISGYRVGRPLLPAIACKSPNGKFQIGAVETPFRRFVSEFFASRVATLSFLLLIAIVVLDVPAASAKTMAGCPSTSTISAMAIGPIVAPSPPVLQPL